MASDSRFRVTGISFLFMCASLFLTAYSARNPRFASVGTAALNEMQLPIQSISNRAFGWFGSMWSNYVALRGVREQYEVLQDRTRSLEEDKAHLLELEEENKRLRKLINAPEAQTLPILGARVVAYDPSSWVQAVMINRGSSDDVKIGMAVITSEGVIGQIIAVGFKSSKVLLVTDHSSGIDAQLENSRVRGIVQGEGRKNLHWKFVLEDDDVKLGDRVITSGMDGVYPPGLFIGRVIGAEPNTAGMFQQIEIAPAANLARLEDVLIVKEVQKTEPLTLPTKKKSNE